MGVVPDPYLDVKGVWTFGIGAGIAGMLRLQRQKAQLSVRATIWVSSRPELLPTSVPSFT
jgi:GH24 family phage-related lysozyme (muramidase)